MGLTLFRDREEALENLAEQLALEGVENQFLVAISEAGEFYASRLADRFGLEWERLFIERLYSPINPETTLGAISETKEYILLEELIDSFEMEWELVYDELERLYTGRLKKRLLERRKDIISLAGKRVILIDEVVETGLGMMCGIKSCYRGKVETVAVAVPIISSEALEAMEQLVDKLFIGRKIENFVTGRAYFKNYRKE
jgi:putative phosphoribosyl transferase